MYAATLLAGFRRPRRPFGRTARALLVWAVVSTLFLTPFATALAATASMSLSGGVAHEMPCSSAMKADAAEVDIHSLHAAAQEGDDDAPSPAPCPMMTGTTCLSLVAVSPPSAIALAVPPISSDDHVRLVSADLTPQVVPPPQRPPNTL